MLHRKQRLLKWPIAGRQPRAVTLLELTIVTLIIAIVSAAAVPNYVATLERHRADAAARRIIADLERAKQRARIASQSQSVVFDLQTNSYSLTGIADANHPSRDYSVNLSDSISGAVLTQATLGGDTTVKFNGYGIPDSGGTISVRAGKSTRNIIISSGSGVIALQ